MIEDLLFESTEGLFFEITEVVGISSKSVNLQNTRVEANIGDDDIPDSLHVDILSHPQEGGAQLRALVSIDREKSNAR